MRSSVFIVMIFCIQPIFASGLIKNGNFEQGLTGWNISTKNAEIISLGTYDTWNTYSLNFKTKNQTNVYFYINVSPDKYTGGQVWFDNIRGEGLDIKNGSFEDCYVNGLAAGWEHQYGMYNKMKRHAKQLIGTDFQYASDGVLSMRFFGPEQKKFWKLPMQPAPKRMEDGWKPVHAMSPWRPLAESTMMCWQKIKVKPNTDYTIKMDYRFDKKFNGSIRTVVGNNFQPWGIIAHSGWQMSEFQELQEMRDRFGESFATMRITNGQASLAQEITVKPGENYHLSADILTTRTYNKKPLAMTISLICEDSETKQIISKDSYHWDGAPGYIETAVEDQIVQGAASTLRCSFVSPSKKIRVRIIVTGEGTHGNVILGNVELSQKPQLIPLVHQANWKNSKENFQILDNKLTYEIVRGNANDIEGALWLVARDLKKQKIEFIPEIKASVSISIGTFTERGKQGYRLSVSPKGIQIESATARGAQYALMTLLELIGDNKDGKIIVAGDITDWPDMPVRGVIMESCSQFMPRQKNPVRLTDSVYHDNSRQTWCFEDFLQLVRWKFNTVFWRSTGYSDKLDKECRRFHIDSMGFVSTISDPPNNKMLTEHPEWIEGVWMEDEKAKLKGFDVVHLNHKHILRTAKTNIIVTNLAKTVTYVESKDYRVFGKLGVIAKNRKFEGGEPFGIARVKGSSIPNGETVYVSYDYIVEFGAETTYHRQYCLSHPDVIAAVGEQTKKVAAEWKRKYLHIRGDELSFVNTDSRCKKRGMKACDLLIEHINFIISKAREGNPDVQVCMWNDSISPYITGFKWGFTEEGPAPPKDVWQMIWHYGPGMPMDVGWAEVKLCQKFGLSTIVLPWYNLRNIREWAQVVGDARRRGWNCMGIIDTPWGHPGPYVNFKETARVSWKVPQKGEKGFVEFRPPAEIND